MLDLPLSQKQLVSCRESTARVNLWEGSIRSGKTLSALLRWLIYCATAPRGGELVMVGRTRDSVWRNMVAPLQDVDLFGIVADQVIGNYGAPTVIILGRRVHILGASDAKAEKVIRGMTVAGACVDELTTIPEEFFTQLLGRMSVTGAQLFGTTNPDNPAHWLKRKFLDRLAELPDWRAWKFTIRDNPSLSPEYVDSISREFTGLWYRRFILGEWVAAEGAIFDMWDPDKHIVPWESLPPIRRLLGVGIDYGTQHATAAITLGLGYDRKLYAVDELRIDPAQSQVRLTDQQQSKAIKTWLGTQHTPEVSGLTPEWIVADPAGASLREQLHQDGITTTAADKAVNYGIGVVASLLGTRELLVTDRCPGLILEMPGYSWDPKATLRGEDKPIKTADDSLDAFRYVIVTLEQMWRSELASRTPTF